ncbi:MAG: hypothetical protein R3E32_25690 [Chitinophagales bacterium]
MDLITLVYKPYDKSSPLQITNSLEKDAVKDVKFIQFCMHFLMDMQTTKYYKLTKTGNLIRKVLHQLYDYRIYTDEYVDDGTRKILQEEDFDYAHLTHTLLKMGGVVRKQHNKLLITKKGEKLMQDEGKLYLQLLETYTSKYNWSYMSYDPEDVVQLGWAYTMYHFMKHGNREIPVETYAEAYLLIFPKQLKEFNRSYSTPKEQYLACFRNRFFGTFNNLFEFAEVKRVEGKYKTQIISAVKKTPLADKVFAIRN